MTRIRESAQLSGSAATRTGPPPVQDGGGPTGQSAAWIDLRNTTFHDRRDQLLGALRKLRPGQELQVTSDRAEDVYWLEWEAEARMQRAYSWSPSADSAGAARTAVRLAG
jgi:uncharacterized protein (DUF2249 family)